MARIVDKDANQNRESRYAYGNGDLKPRIKHLISS
jgi:hypothetical protein